MTKKEIGAILFNLRETSGKSREEVAELLNKSVKTVGHWETGYAQPDANTLFLLCTIYGADLNASFGFESKKEKAPLPPDALKAAEAYNGLDTHGKAVIDSVLKCEKERIETERTKAEIVPIAKKTIPLLHDVAAGPTDISGEIEDEYEVDADSPAYLAIQISDDSMEPFLPDGSVQLVCYEKLSIGDIGVFMLDGGLLCKQYVRDNFGNVYLNSLNRDRADASVMISTSSNHTLTCYGKIICDPIPVQM
ncbi:MAG: helix-turn-helix domain-containing protein [Oscillospiraceae bacterium]|nr:helix-turn-helix domain-containing protein [Oscillospiraceae bacterium]